MRAGNLGRHDARVQAFPLAYLRGGDDGGERCALLSSSAIGRAAASARSSRRSAAANRRCLSVHRASCYSRRAMEFGLFVQAHVPKHEVNADPEGAEHVRLLRELELAEACDRAGWKYVWSVEHHFLAEDSHISASEIFLPYIAARTKRIHVGSAIYNITPPVNHPARIAERVAMLDHLSEGRFEFGAGRGSSSTEFKGFGIPDGETTRA